LETYKVDQWQGTYDNGWQGDIVPEAFSHPAKFSRGLIHRIYQHAREMGWVKPGDYCLDPFGGVALGGLDAMGMGLNWIGVELEEKFVRLGEQNIDLWQRELAGWPNLGTARMVNGDSRSLKAVIEQADIVISSPPFHTSVFGGGSGIPVPKDTKNRIDNDYGHTPGNLANLKEGKFEMVISSPVYPDARQGWNKPDGAENIPASYGDTIGQLGSMKEGPFDLVCSSPPWEAQMNQGGAGTSKIIQKIALQTSRDPNKPARRVMSQSKQWPESENQLGNSSGDTFWSASREILEQCFDLLKPGGHAIWVTKNYIKAKKIVPFSDKWLALCESVGFRLVCRHQAMLVKDHGTQVTIHGDEKITTERKSFFRRLAESKGSPRIDWEDVICLKKEIEDGTS